MKYLLAGIGLLMVMHGPALADPLAPAHLGKVQCYSPDRARKTCRSIGSYSFQSDGSIANQAEALIAPQQFVVMKTSAPVAIRGEAECGTPRKEDIDAAEIDVNGQKLTEEKAAPVRVQIETAMAPFIGKEICSTYASQADGTLLVTETLAGAPMPGHSVVLWVDPSEGYKVAP